MEKSHPQMGKHLCTCRKHIYTKPASGILTCITHNFHQTPTYKVTHECTDTPIFIQSVCTQTYASHVYARTCINTLACKLGHAAFSEMHMGAHTYVLTWVQVHTHDLLKAAPSACGRAKKKLKKKIARPGVVPAAEMTRPVLQSFPSERVDICVQVVGLS